MTSLPVRMFNNNAWPDHDDGEDKDERNDVMARRDEEEKKEPAIGPVKGDFVAPPEVMEQDEASDALPSQEEFWRPPTRFGSVPVEKEPLGWDRRRGFRKLFPQVMLPFQVVDRVQFGHTAFCEKRVNGMIFIRDVTENFSIMFG